MAEIVIVGLGPGDVKHLTLEAWQMLSHAKEIWLRTAHHPVVTALPEHLALHSFDALYEQAGTFEEIYATIAERVVALAREPGCDSLIYAVPGHPLMGESTVTGILARAREVALDVRVVAGLSFVEPLLTALEIDALNGLQVVDALDIITRYHPPLNPDTPALIAQVYSRAVASDLKLVLMNQYPDEHQVALVDAACNAAQTVTWLPLYQIDWHEATPLTSLYLPPLSPVSSFEGLQDTVAHLRSPEGCPWDREQTPATLRACLLEEAYEVLAAIDAEDTGALQEELGDLLMQVVMLVQLSVELGDFRMTDVIAGIDTKLKRRHPHVWGEVTVADVDAVLQQWEVLKREERDHQGDAESSLLAGIPQALPALAQASEYYRRMARVGLTGDILAGPVWEVVERIAPQDEAALGELLFACVRWACQHDLDPESALRALNHRFARRVQALIVAAGRQGKALGDLSPDELAHLWSEQR